MNTGLSDSLDLALHCPGLSEIPSWNFISHRNVQLIFSLVFHAVQDIVLMTFSLSPHYRVFKKSSPNCKVRFPRVCYEVEGGLFRALSGPFPSLSCLSLLLLLPHFLPVSLCVFLPVRFFKLLLIALSVSLNSFLIYLVVCLLPSFRSSFDCFFISTVLVITALFPL